MGSDDRFKIQHRTREAKKVAIKKMLSDTWLIISEGKCTECNYFNGLKKYITNEYGVNLNIIPKGTGRNTTSLVTKAEIFVDEMVNETKLPIPYSNIIFVFDKDSFLANEFNRAISLTSRYKKEYCEDIQNIICAWSNECFELWLCLHFEYISSALVRGEYFNRLTNIFRRNGILKPHENYVDHGKNLKNIFENIYQCGGSLENALRNARRLEKEFQSESSPAKKNPCTMMHKAVEALLEEAEHYKTT